MTRRELFQNAGLAGAATIYAGSANAAARVHPPGRPAATTSGASENLVELTVGEMIIAFDRRYGSISSIRRKGDGSAVNFIGNEHNTPGVDVSNSRWTGDLVTAAWEVTDLNPAAGGVDRKVR